MNRFIKWIRRPFVKDLEGDILSLNSQIRSRDVKINALQNAIRQIEFLTGTERGRSFLDYVLEDMNKHLSEEFVSQVFDQIGHLPRVPDERHLSHIIQRLDIFGETELVRTVVTMLSQKDMMDMAPLSADFDFDSMSTTMMKSIQFSPKEVFVAQKLPDVREF